MNSVKVLWVPNRTDMEGNKKVKELVHSGRPRTQFPAVAQVDGHLQSLLEAVTVK